MFFFSHTSRNLPTEKKQKKLARRRVKIDFLQNAELPEGTVETISAGGGKTLSAENGHEGGGLTVKVKERAIHKIRQIHANLLSELHS